MNLVFLDRTRYHYREYCLESASKHCLSAIGGSWSWITVAVRSFKIYEIRRSSRMAVSFRYMGEHKLHWIAMSMLIL